MVNTPDPSGSVVGGTSAYRSFAPLVPLGTAFKPALRGSVLVDAMILGILLFRFDASKGNRALRNVHVRTRQRESEQVMYREESPLTCMPENMRLAGESTDHYHEKI